MFGIFVSLNILLNFYKFSAVLMPIFGTFFFKSLIPAVLILSRELKYDNKISFVFFLFH